MRAKVLAICAVWACEALSSGALAQPEYKVAPQAYPSPAIDTLRQNVYERQHRRP